MMRDESIEEASRAGKTSGSGERSMIVIGVSEGISEHRVRARAVLRPNTPEPIIRMLFYRSPG